MARATKLAMRYATFMAELLHCCARAGGSEQGLSERWKEWRRIPDERVKRREASASVAGAMSGEGFQGRLKSTLWCGFAALGGHRLS